eukprot:GAHX01000233.1.p1 GENE.GAHX01000233.1~~GAHX01000233.1.p1  ORF type:complete len:306 (-),score=88.05 GAHX01000233.1:37-954(-)
MLELKLDKPSQLNSIFNIIKELVDNVSVNIDGSGLRLKTLDSSHVAFIALELQSAFFNEFRCDNSFDLGISTINFTKVLQTAKANEELTITANDDASKLLVTIFNKNNSSGTKNIKVNLLSMDEEEIDMSSFSHTAIVRMSSKLFREVVKSLTSISESITFEVKNGKISFKASSDTNDASFDYANNDEFDEDPNDFVNITSKEEFTVQFCGKFLEKFSRTAHSSKEVEIKLHEASPSVFSYDMVMEEPKVDNKENEDDYEEEAEGEEVEETETEKEKEKKKKAKLIPYGTLVFSLAPVVQTDADI